LTPAPGTVAAGEGLGDGEARGARDGLTAACAGKGLGVAAAAGGTGFTAGDAAGVLGVGRGPFHRGLTHAGAATDRESAHDHTLSGVLLRSAVLNGNLMAGAVPSAPGMS
jgi:hypothetical protein